MMPTNRRTFLGAAGVLALSGRLASAAPSERVRVAVIGVRGRGADLARSFAGTEDAEVVALCDIDDEAFAKPVKAVEKVTGKAPRTEKDFRRLLDDKAIDAIVVATPDHWHALIDRHGLPGGQGRLRREAGQPQRGRRPADGRGGAEVQAGSSRPAPSGGAWRTSRTPSPTSAPARSARWAWPAPGSTRHAQADRPRPARTGPRGRRLRHVARARPRPPVHERTASTTTGTGSGTGAPASWATTASTASTSPAGAWASTPRSRVSSGGGKYVFDDDQEVPDTQIVTWEFPETLPRLGAPDVVEARHRRARASASPSTATRGRCSSTTRAGGSRTARPAGGKPDRGARPRTSPNFLDCVKTRATPNADIEIGHLSTRLCHLGNIAHRAGPQADLRRRHRVVPRRPEANKLLAREYSARFEMPSQV